MKQNCDDTKHTWAHPFGDRLDRAPFSGAVPPLEHDADLEPLVPGPLLQLHQFDVQLLQFGIVILARQRCLGQSLLGM